MAKDTREIVVRIIEGKGSQKQTHQEKENDKQKQNKETNETDGTLGAVVGTMLANSCIKTAKTSVNFALNTVGRWSGDIEASRQVEKLQIAYGIANDVHSVAQSVVYGATAGSIVPVVGTAIGAVVGAVVGITNEALSYGQEYYQFRTGVVSDNRSVMFAKQRAGKELNDWSR